ncbi:MAG: BsuPI-related putative proteinase inhibitor [Halobacteriales archaeon]
MQLDATLDVDVRSDSVAFALTARNVGEADVEMTFSDAQLAEFVVSDDGGEVWRYGEGRMFAQMLQTTALAPGESMTVDATWEDPDPGDYEVVATLLASSVDLEERGSFSV